METRDGKHESAYDPDCYLCPGNLRTSGVRNPAYADTFVFTNDFPALMETPSDAGSHSGNAQGLLHAEPVNGTCRVVCFSPQHDLTLARLDENTMGRVITAWCEQAEELSQRYAWVQIFENRGAAMGCSSPHPHGQIWATSTLPQIAAEESTTQRRYLAERGRPMLMDYVAIELEQRSRVVVKTAHWLVVVPYWATWPFETLVLPKRPVARLQDLSAVERESLAEALKKLLCRYDNVFEASFPYSMGWHPAPAGTDGDPWVLHAHFYPPLLRSPTVRKFMVGYEMLAEIQRDMTAEQAAERLQAVSDVHYLDRTR